jgi:hypothetical protein
MDGINSRHFFGNSPLLEVQHPQTTGSTYFGATPMLHLPGRQVCSGMGVREPPTPGANPSGQSAGDTAR